MSGAPSSVFTNPSSSTPEQAAAYVDAVLALVGDGDPLDTLRSTGAAIEGRLLGISHAATAIPEGKGKWSVRQVLRHLADSEIVWSWRLRMVLAHDRPALTGYDQDAWAERLGYADADPWESVADFRASREANLRLLDRASPEALDRVGVHSERGEESVRHMTRLYAGHDRLHLRQLDRIRAAVGGPAVDSETVGDPALHLPMERLERGLAALRPAPALVGRVGLIVARGPGGVRATPDRARFTTVGGLDGDAWSRGRRPDPEAQLTVMELGVARLLANGQSLTLFGDQLFLDLDLSAPRLPPGTRIRVGDAVLEVTPLPHNGCQKFRTRFGTDGLRFVSRPETRDRNFRGVYMRVVADGEIRLGDEVAVIREGSR